MATATMTKATFKVEDFRDAMSKCLMVPVQKYNKLPVLLSALLEVKGGKATLTSSDLERSVAVTFDCSAPDMVCLLPKNTVNKFLQGNGGDIAIAVVDDTHVTLERVGLGKVTLTIMKVSDWAPIPQPDKVKWHTLDAKSVLKMMRIVAVACSWDDSRPILTGVCLEDGAMAAADGFRLNVYKSDKLAFGLGTKFVPSVKANDEGVVKPNQPMEEKPNQVIVPMATAILASRVFGKEESIEIAFDDARVYIRGGNALITGQLVQGNFPDWTKLVPENYDSRITFSVPLMAQRLRMMSKTCSGIVRFNFYRYGNSDEATISAESEEEFKYALQCPVKLEQKNPKVDSKIAFNQRYIDDAIKPFSLCNLEINSPSSPGKFTGDIEGLTIVVMPMFTSW